MTSLRLTVYLLLYSVLVTRVPEYNTKISSQQLKSRSIRNVRRRSEEGSRSGTVPTVVRTMEPVWGGWPWLDPFWLAALVPVQY